MSARSGSGAGNSSWEDRVGVTLGGLCIVAVVLAALWNVIRFALVAVKAPLLAAVFLASSTVVVLAVKSVCGRITARRRDREHQFWLLRQRLARHNPDGYRELLALLRYPTGRRATGALIQISDRPALIDGLIFHARRGDLGVELQPFADRVRRIARPHPDAVAWALASLHLDGHVRQAAVAGMAARPLPVYVPFLVERAVEWVEPVRGRSLAALREMIAEQPGRYRPLLAQDFSRVAARRHAAALAALLEPGGEGATQSA